MSVLKAGEFGDYSDSMAEEMEKAMDKILDERFGLSDGIPDAQRDQFRILIFAVAQGIVNHLVQNNEFALIFPSGTEIRMKEDAIILKCGSTRLKLTDSGFHWTN